MLLVSIIAGIVLAFMPFGQRLYATGGNSRAAAYAGINTNRVRFIALVFCALCATMAGLINVAYFRSFNPVAGQFRELDGIAAVIIGGGSIFGGYGTIIGALAGAAVITLVRALLQLNVQGFTMPQHWINVFIGVILIGAVLIDIWVRQANIFGTLRAYFAERRQTKPGSRQCLIPRRARSRSSRCGASTSRSARCRRCATSTSSLYPGEILGLVGDNSAGKSTLMKILTGAYQRDTGEILVAGKPVHFKSPHESRDVGIEMIYQDFALCGNMDVGQNIFLGRWPRRGPFVDRKRCTREADRGAEAAQGRRELRLPARREPFRRPPAIGGDRPRHLVRAARRHPRRADRQPLGDGDRAAARDDARAEEARRRPDHHLAPAQDIFAVGDRVMVLKRGENVGDRYVKNTTEQEVLEIIVSGTRESALTAEQAAKKAA